MRIDPISVNANIKIQNLKPFFKGTESVLDFGCGDLTLARSLKNIFPKLTITGVDVVDFKGAGPGVKFVKYGGNKLPFKSKSFDTVISYHVLHHCDDPHFSFSECVRVANKKIIVVEPVYRMAFEKPFMRFFDSLFNTWKDHSIPMNFQFLSKTEWLTEFKKNKVVIRSVTDVELLPRFIPTGRSLLFELIKK